MVAPGADWQSHAFVGVDGSGATATARFVGAADAAARLAPLPGSKTEGTKRDQLPIALRGEPLERWPNRERLARTSRRSLRQRIRARRSGTSTGALTLRSRWLLEKRESWFSIATRPALSTEREIA